MFEFLKAAFPWIVIGIAVAVFAANHVAEKKKATKSKDANDDEAQGNRMPEGMCIGMCLGVSFGTAGVCDLATGISLGMLLGMVVGMGMKK